MQEPTQAELNAVFAQVREAIEKAHTEREHSETVAVAAVAREGEVSDGDS